MQDLGWGGLGAWGESGGCVKEEASGWAGDWGDLGDGGSAGAALKRRGDSLRSPFGQPAAVYLRCAPVPGTLARG
jgi:hypothetical protein